MSAPGPDPKGYLTFQQQGGIADLSDRTKLRLTGADRVRYLNGQVSNNISQLKTGSVTPACVRRAR